MRVAKQRTRPVRSRNRLAVLVALVLTGLLVLAIFLLVPRLAQSTDSEAPTSLGPSGQPSANSAPSTTVVTRSEVVERLREIFRVRDMAVRTRNPRLFEGIYTVDCPCLEGDKQLVRRLRKEHLLWRDLNVSVAVEETERVNDRLWILSGTVTTSSFKIVKESGAIIRTLPEGKEHSRFALARPQGERDWLLGRASVIEDRD
jgi:hypothetical protein